MMNTLSHGVFWSLLGLCFMASAADDARSARGASRTRQQRQPVANAAKAEMDAEPEGDPREVEIGRGSKSSIFG